ncbi:MAG TPA: hypothetical protein PKW63_12325 [Vicinamibacterales bacterium]|nr:hypothetical protein [Vicinamibacterales bacterium]
MGSGPRWAIFIETQPVVEYGKQSGSTGRLAFLLGAGVTAVAWLVYALRRRAPAT